MDGWAPTRSRGESCGGSWRRGLVSPHVTSVPRPIPSAPFGDDDGSADPRVRAALEEFDRAEGGPANVLAALATSRLLIPIVAVPGDDGPNDDVPGADGSGGRADHSHADMATVLTTGRDGRSGLLAFTSVETLQRWNTEARPSPVPTRTAAEAALAEGADALVIDLAGPVMFSVDARDLRSLASGWRPLGTWQGVGTADPPVAPSARATEAATIKRRVRRAGGRLWRRARRTLVR